MMLSELLATIASLEKVCRGYIDILSVLQDFL